MDVCMVKTCQTKVAQAFTLCIKHDDEAHEAISTAEEKLLRAILGDKYEEIVSQYGVEVEGAIMVNGIPLDEHLKGEANGCM